MKKYSIFLIILVLSTQRIFTQTIEIKKKWPYPIFKSDTAIDYYFGKKVIDPFRNLEDLNNPQVKSWIKYQNELYDTIIHSITNRNQLDVEIENFKKIRKKWADFPRIVNNRLFYPFGFFEDDDIERLGYTDSIHEEPIEIFNTKEINSKDKSIYSFNYYEPSLDGKYIAFGISPNGSEKATILIIDVETKKLLPERIEFSKAGNIQWLPDGSGFLYIRDKDILTEEDKNTFYEDAKVCLHKLNTNPSGDKPILSRLLSKVSDLKKENWPRLFVFPSSDKVLVNLAKGSYYVIYYAYLKDLLDKPAEKIEWKKIFSEEDRMSSNAMYGDRFFGLSFKNNPNGQLITMKLPDIEPKVVYDASGFVLDDLALTRKGIYITTIEKGLSKLIKINLINYKDENINLPFLGGLNLTPSFSIVTSFLASDYLLFILKSYDKQIGGYLCNENKSIIKTDIFPEVQYTDPPIDLKVEEIEVPSHDGTLVPLSITYGKGIKFDGTNPTIIEAYGAFGISKKPEFNRNRLAWFKHGGIFAIAHVRGGSEKGDNWYKGGFKATKSNSWKDFIACAEYLIKNRYTSPEKLAAMGASAGGITIGRAITERPDLFKAAVIYVGVLNTIRMENTFNPGVAEFGTVKDSLEFQYLFNMDTYHHIRDGIKYPSVLFTAGLNDARVTPWEPAKAVAKMQQVSKNNNVVLFRVAGTGHFDYPSDADVFSFLFWQLGHPNFKLNNEDSLKSNTKKKL
jgi:prolyl oligopeptidase